MNQIKGASLLDEAGLTTLADRYLKCAREIEGDSDSPLRVAVANKWWDKAARYYEQAAALRARARP